MPQLKGSSAIEVSAQNNRVDELKIEVAQDGEEDSRQPYRRKLRGRSTVSIPVPENDSPSKKPGKQKVVVKKKEIKSKAVKPVKKTNVTKIVNKRKISDIEDEDNSVNDDSENRATHSCELCHKNFSSAFILCLHLQIHKKVKMAEECDSKDVPLLDNDPEDIKLEIESEEDDSVESNDDVNQDVEVRDKSNINELKQMKIKDQKVPGAGILNKNFVESLKKNLSVAMKRKS